MQESMTIVVDEVTDDLHDYYQNINEEFDRHGKCVKFFCDMNGISLTFQDVGVAEGNYNGYNWCRAIAVLGYLSIQDSKEYTVIYLPPEVTPHQYEWMQSRRKLFQSKSEKIAIYSYYENKEALFEAVLRPVLYDWERVLTSGGEDNSKHTDSDIYGLSKAETECILNLFDHRQEFIILIDKSEGTKYENEKERFVKDIEEHLNKHRNDDTDDTVFLHIIANNFVDGLMQIMYHYKGKEWAVMILHKLSKMYLSGIGL